ncbi:MAG: YkvA family protein [Aquificaceae bacterium]|nr:YkvA family protein [Aquificaceae bacterium]
MEERLKAYYRDVGLAELRRLLDEKLRKVPPTMEHVRNLILDAKMFYHLLADQDFELKEETRRDFTAALLYFIEHRDAIRDSIPFIGYWDDYKLVQYVKNKHKEEIERYFSQVKHFIANYF